MRVVVTVGHGGGVPVPPADGALAPLLAPGGDLEQATGRPVDVLWQTGCTPVDDLPIDATPFLPAADLTAALAEADIVVSHAGTGSALANLAAGRFAVVVQPGRGASARRATTTSAELADELTARGLAMHRAPEEITVDDLLATRTHGVRRLPRRALPSRCGEPARTP